MKKIVYWLPPLVWMGVIFYFSNHPRIGVSEDFIVQFVIFKALHIIEYGFLYILLYRAIRNTQSQPQWQTIANAFIITILYGITDEIHQVFIPSREGRVRDVGIDAIGVSIAAYYIWKLLPKAPKRLKNWAKKLRII